MVGPGGLTSLALDEIEGYRVKAWKVLTADQESITGIGDGEA